MAARRSAATLERSGGLCMIEVMPPIRISLTLFHACAWFCAMLLIASCSQTQKLPLNVSEGEATSTLLEFARQANVEIIFDAQRIDGVRTQPINGVFDPQSALRIMLQDTPLSVYFDTSSGAYAIVRNKDSQASIRIPFPHTMAAMRSGVIHNLTKKAPLN